MLAEPAPNQSNGASWRRELAPEPGVPGEVGDPGSPRKLSWRCWETSGFVVHPHRSEREYALYHT